MKFNLDVIFTDTEFKELKELSKTIPTLGVCLGLSLIHI